MGSDIFIVMAGLMLCASSPFLFCLFGGEATNNYAGMADCVFGCNWQRLSLNSQKYMILMIANMQQPLEYHGFGIVVLNLETFQSVWKILCNVSISPYILTTTNLFRCSEKLCLIIWCSKLWLSEIANGARSIFGIFISVGSTNYYNHTQWHLIHNTITTSDAIYSKMRI